MRKPIRAVPLMERHERLILAVLLLVAFIVRKSALSGFNESVYEGVLLMDELVSHNWALAILESRSYTAPDLSPLPAYVFAAAYRIFAVNQNVARHLNIVIGVVNCLLAYLIARRIAGKGAGLAACFCAVFYKPYIFYDMTVHKETLGVFLFGLTLYLFILQMERSSWQWMFVLGLAAGLLINTRQNALVLIPVIACILFIHQYREEHSLARCCRTAAVFGAAILLAAAPFAIKNYVQSGHISPVPAGGYNLYFSNNPYNKTPYYRTLSFVSPVPSEQWIGFTAEASRREGRELSPGEASTFWTGESLRFMKEDMAGSARRLLLKSLAVINAHEEADNYDVGFMAGFIPVLNLPLFAIWFILPAGLAGLAVRSQKSVIARSIAVIVITYSLTMLLFFANMRVRLPLLTALIPYAAIFFLDLYRTAKEGKAKKTVALLMLFLGIAVAGFLPIPGAGDLSAHYNTHAIVLSSKGRTGEAVRYWQESSAMNKSYSAFADLSLAGIDIQRRDLSGARGYLDRIPDDSYAAAYKFDLLGDILMRESKPVEAAEAYKRSLDIHPGQRFPRKKLVDIYRATGSPLAVEEERTLEYVTGLFERDKGEVRGQRK